MRRKAGELVPLEVSILEAALHLQSRGKRAFHGYALAGEIQVASDQRLLTSHGTLYRALHRLERAGLIESFWEEATISEREGRPRRRLYRATASAAPAFKRARQNRAAGARSLKPRLGTS